MKNDIRHTLNLTELPGAEERAARKAAQLESDAQLAENAKNRTGDVKLEKWWSVIAGVTLVAAFIMYTCYLTIPALILMALLAIYIICVYVRMYLKRRSVESAVPEISPNRGVETFIKKALGQSVTGRDVSGYMDRADIAAFGAALSEKLAGLGLSAEGAAVKADAKVVQADAAGDKCSRIPVSVVLDCGGAQVELKWTATFALAATGDCMPDTKLKFE